MQLPMFGDDLPQVGVSHCSEKVGNTRLIEHGIFQDESEYRIHVSTKNVYIFSTELMKQRCLNGSYIVKPSFQKGIVTAQGFVIPISSITDLKKVEIPDILTEHYGWPPPKGTDLGRQGHVAEAIVKAMMELELIDFPRSTNVETCKTRQFAGVDLVYIAGRVNFQVKSDLGVEMFGNIYIQTHECNPFRQY